MDERAKTAWRSWLTLLLILVPLALSGAEGPATAPAWDYDRVLSRGFQLEEAGDWSRAIRLYQEATRVLPDSELLRQRLKHCERHFGLSRRYHDRSFRDELLVLPVSQALKLHDEVLQRIEAFYVEPVSTHQLFQAGVENLLIACEDAEFIHTNLARVGTERVSQFRDRLRAWRTVAVRDRQEANRQLRAVTDLAEAQLGLHAAPVVLEFIYGACDALDEYSACLTPNRLTDLYAVIDGEFVGIGVELRSDEQGLLVVNVLPGSPAAEAGMRGGDHIVAIGDMSTVGLATEEAANRLQGEEGSVVLIWVQSPNDSEPRRVTLRRRAVEVQSVSLVHMMIPEEGIGYVRLSGFQKSTATELEHAVSKLSRQGMRSLILDLRGNPGGLLTAAVEVGDRFLGEGNIVSTRGRAEGQNQTYRAHRSNTWTFPLVLLIDEESASASEILAGAIQDHRRGTVVGVKSYGKGSVQSIYSLETAQIGIRLTTAHFFSPRGRAYSHQGVIPDIRIEPVEEEKWSASAAQVSDLDPARDVQLAGALRVCRQLAGRRP